jgi:hypothetical protein
MRIRELPLHHARRGLLLLLLLTLAAERVLRGLRLLQAVSGRLDRHVRRGHRLRLGGGIGRLWRGARRIGRLLLLALLHCKKKKCLRCFY